MNTLAKVGIGVGVVALAAIIFPSLKGPYNRIKSTVNEKLDSEFVVDNYKAEYVNLYDKRAEVVNNLNKLSIEARVTQKKLEYAVQKQAAAKAKLVETGTDDLRKFSAAKDAYESAEAETKNLETMLAAYNNAVKKLEDAIQVIDVNMSKTKANVATLESKKTLVDSLKAVNKTVETVNGLGEGTLGFNVEKLDDDALRESIKLEALKNGPEPVLDKAAAEAYLKSL